VMLQFAFAGFAGGKTAPADKVKVLVCDLDNTLWHGIIVEDGLAACKMKNGIREVLSELDRRGILLSIASYNDYEPAKKKLEDEGLWDLFVSPEINRGPKSESIKRIISRLNVGKNAVAFIDDTASQREEVSGVIPGIRVYEDSCFRELVNLAEFDVPVTEESRNRRKMYQKEFMREQAYSGSGGDYDAFLRSCDIKLKIKYGFPDPTDMKRVEELVQRTNQLNFSGKHYAREDLKNILDTGNITPVVMSAEDKFGEYGIIGFAMIEEKPGAVVIHDMMFSCRVMGKKLDLSFLKVLKERCLAGRIPVIFCLYNKMERNTPAREILKEAGFMDAGNGQWKLDVEKACSIDVPVEVVID